MSFFKRTGVEIVRSAVIALVISSTFAGASFWQWSQTAGNNATADPNINWAIGMAPSAVSGSSRAMMAQLAKYRDDVSGLLVTGGIATAYTVTTNQGLASVPNDGQLVAITPHVTSGANPSLQADGGGIYPIQTTPGTNIPSGTLIAGTPYTLKYNASAATWIIRDFYGNPYAIPLGGFLYSSLPNPPNSSFVAPAGQCISTTTYNAYWIGLGSPASGGCPGGQFALVDVRGRNLTALDNVGGTAAGRLTASSVGCGTAFTSFGASCSNGTESKFLTASQIPIINSAGTNSISVNGGAAANVPATTGGIGNYLASLPGGGAVYIPYSGSPWGGNINVFTGNNTISVTSNNTGGGAHPTVDPNIGVYIYLRVL